MIKKTSLIVGKICTELFPESKDEAEAIEHYKKVLERRIEFKHTSNIDATQDIELHSAVEHCRLDLIKNQRKAG